MNQPHPLLRYFEHAHLPPQLRDAPKPFADLAAVIAGAEVTDESQRDVGMQKLLEAKDCFVRSCLMVKPVGDKGEANG